MKLRQHLLFAVLLMFGVALPACGGTGSPVNTSKTPQALQPTGVSGELLKVVRADGSAQSFTVADLNKLPQQQITLEGQLQEGPKLLDVLTAAGVTDFSEVSLAGSSAPVTLSRAQVDDHTVLDFTNHGTVKLATPYVSKADWTKDVSTITVK